MQNTGQADGPRTAPGQPAIPEVRLRRLGVLGGMSWESTAVYYRRLNQGVAARCGGLHSAPLLLDSLDFAPVAALQADGQWDALGASLAQAAVRLREAGAEGLLLATNTMHRVAPALEAAVGPLPLLHIGDAIGAALRVAGHRRVGLLGTRFTMEQPFLIGHLQSRHGLDVQVPGPADRLRVHALIYDELCRGRVLAASREALRAVVARLAGQGAEAVVLGCTELGLLIDPVEHREQLAIPAFDSTALHADAAVAWMTTGH